MLSLPLGLHLRLHPPLPPTFGTKDIQEVIVGRCRNISSAEYFVRTFEKCSYVTFAALKCCTYVATVKKTRILEYSDRSCKVIRARRLVFIMSGQKRVNT